MADLESFFNLYSGVFVWIASGILFLGFMVGIYQMVLGLWRYFKSNRYL